jgi:hypothetical protein
LTALVAAADPKPIAEGKVSVEKVARDDWYAIEAEGYEEGSVARTWFKFQFTPRSGGSPRDVAEQSGVLVVLLQRSRSKAKDRRSDEGKSRSNHDQYSR